MNDHNDAQLGPMLSTSPDQNTLRFSGHEPGRIHINGTTYTASLLILNDRIIQTNLSPYNTLTAQTIMQWSWEYTPDLILIGAANHSPHALYDQVQQMNHQPISLEIMSTEACIRAYISMQIEQRQVLCYLTVA